MSKGNVNLEDCLSLLYDYSNNFHISLELIQKLSQQLKLETFIDKLSNDSHDAKRSRLTIAGSTILIDIDFLEDNRVTSLALSSANQDENELKQVNNSQDCFARDNYYITIDWTKNNISFLKQMGSSANKTSIAEQILLNNLKSDRLNQFPFNLQYLAKIDKLSSTNYNLFNLLEKLTLLLKTINHLEGLQIENNQDWQLNCGFSSFMGRVVLNDSMSNELGLFIEFWRDFRYINRKYQEKTGKQTELIGKKHKILISIESSMKPQINYFQQDDWNLSTGKYQVSYKVPTNILSSNLQSWLINLRLNNHVWLPTYLLKYFDWNYTVEKELGPDDEIFPDLNQSREILKVFNNVEFKIIQELSLDKFIPIKSLELKKLSDLPIIIPLLRNFLVLSNLIITSLNSKSIEEIDEIFKKPNSRRNSRVNPGELTEEARKKLKESLKLPDDVTDEELLGLNAINESANYSTIALKQTDDIDLQSFINQSPPELKISPYIQFTIVSFNFITNDIHLSIEGYLNEKIYIPFTISNGCIVEKTTKSDEDMDIDVNDSQENSKSMKFLKGLNMTEDIYRTIKHIYK